MFEEADEQESIELILDFQGKDKTTSRWLFLIAVLLIHVFCLGYIWKNIAVPEYTDYP